MRTAGARGVSVPPTDLAWRQLAEAVCELNEHMEHGHKPTPFQLGAVRQAVEEYAEVHGWVLPSVRRSSR